MIDEMWDGASGGRKPRTYRKKARKKFLAVSKKRRPGRAKVRKAVKSQLGYVKRNLSHIEKLSANGNSGLGLTDTERLEVIQTLYRQQNKMLTERKRRVDERIVSLSQPHVRPIVRGKASANVEFGQGKRKYGLDLIKAKLSSTSETWIAMIFLVLNLEKWLSKVSPSLLGFFCLFLSPRMVLKRFRPAAGGHRKGIFIDFAMKSYGF